MLTAEAAEYIADRYTQLRLDTEKSRTLPVTARTLECMIRLATAHAKSRLSDQVQAIDAKNAAALVHYSYYNEAEAKVRSAGKSDDEDDSDDDGNDDDGSSGGGAPRSSQTKGAATPKSAKKPTKAGSTTPKSASKGKGKGKAKDQFDFPDEDGDAAEEVEVAQAKTPSSGRRGRSSASTPAANATAAVDEEDTEPMDATQAEDTTPPSKAQTKQLRETLTEIYSSLRAESIEQSVLVDELEKKFPEQFTLFQVKFVLDEMSEANEVMVVDEQILKI